MVATALVLAVACTAALAASPTQRTLSFEARVTAQAAIERVYYAHQLGATKSFDDAMPKAVLENKVRKYLEQTAALNVYWKTAVTDEMLERELERMAQGTKMPERLLELYAALGNDPFMIKECLARPTLVDRLAHNFFSQDSSFHAGARRRAEELHRQLASSELSPSAEHPNRSVNELLVSNEKFRTLRAGLPPRVGQVSDLKESPDGFTVDVILNETATEVRVARYAVAKTRWDAWWETARLALRSESITAVAADRGPVAGPTARLVANPSTCIADDTWDNGVLDDLPDPRTDNTAVWTGNLMIVWGGIQNYASAEPGTGGRYDPATDSWTSTSTIGAPQARSLHTAVWTGSLMLVWSGELGWAHGDSHRARDGGRYDPATDSWTPIAETQVVSGRRSATAVWTGSVMVVWGGRDRFNDCPNTGGRYDPATGSWTPVSSVNAPSERCDHTAVWTGSRMVVWGGGTSTGGRYDPATDTWTPTSTAGVPSPREGHTAVWTGTEMVVWGGYGPGGTNGFHDTGGRYDPATDSWMPTSTIGAPSARQGHAAVWTGSEMVVWGGYGYSNGSFDAGGRYNPATNSWTPTSTAGAPSARSGHTAVWTGSLMVVWGGGYSTGGRYDPATDGWTPTSIAETPAARTRHTAVWTGSLMVVWGGYGYDGSVFDGGRYDPATDSWMPTSTIAAPSPRVDHTAVWTGSEMVVWGGNGGDYPYVPLDTGGRYDPATDSWLPTSTTNAPSARDEHTAVWTGSSMLIWGDVGAGGRYDPATDGWTPISNVGAPSERVDHTAVWTGTSMIVWGGGFNTGGRYNPATDTWTPTSTAGAPSARRNHTAVWTGSRMLVWGGEDNTDFNAPGGRYDPATNSWSPMSITGAPSARRRHTAVWTGDRMVVWGGSFDSYFNDLSGYFSTGGRYDPATNTWLPTSRGRAPFPRADHTAVWTGTAMLVWGGAGEYAFNSGGRYAVNISPTADRDCDGFTVSEGDCDDTRDNVYPGAPQICDGINNDCNDPAWPAVPSSEANSDGDGFRLCAGDCDDTQASIHPGATESCNGIDENCDGVIDNGGDVLCNDFNVCTDDACHGATGCAHVDRENGIPCNDFDECTTGDTCSGGICGGTFLDCIDGNICTYDSCYPGVGCVFEPNENPCDDGNPCTSGDYCSQGACSPGPLVGCDDGNPCTNDSCDSSSTACVHVANTIPCDDGNQCTVGDRCLAGTCSYSSGTLHCVDQSVCTTDSCNPATGCIYTAISCDDQNPCTDDVCDPVTGCASIIANNGCTDGNACTAGDHCLDGACIPGPPLVCHDNNACTTDLCNPVTGCYFPNNTDPCTDGNRCTKGDVCGGGFCHRGDPAVCNDFNSCTTDSCDPITGCVFANNTFSCNDNSVCTLGDTCRNGSCQGTRINCDDNNPCTDDSCDAATGCINADNTAACDDGSACTTSDKCGGGECRGTTSDPKPKSSGYYKKLCEKREQNQLPYQGDQLTDADAVCVGELTSTFAGISTIDDICDVIYRNHHGGRHNGGPGDGPNGKDCNQGEDELIATALNICRARVCEGQSLDSHCNGNVHTTVSLSLADADAILDDAARTQVPCKRATCELREINNSQALDMNSLLLAREKGQVRLTWASPDVGGTPSSYDIWRRAMGSNDAFVRIGTTAELTFVDASSAGGGFEYEVTAVMN